MEITGKVDGDRRAPSHLSRLCETCSRLDLSRLAWRQGSMVLPCPEVSLGTVDEVKSKETSCELCRLLADQLTEVTTKVGADDILQVKPRTYATLQTSPGDDKLLTVSYLCVEVVPVDFDGTYGPKLPPNFWITGKEQPPSPADFQPWNLMTLQACLDPVPTVGQFCEDIEGHSTSGEYLNFSGRLRTNEVNLRLPRRWLDLCHIAHGTSCNPTRTSKSVVGMRVVDVVNMTIVNAPPNCPYAALSYCWGSVQNFKCTTENYDLLSLPGGLATAPLPNTIRDAITVTLAMSLRYLWVDALCITQDDQDMVQSQIPLMDTIYSAAIVTIVAAGGDNSHSGLPGVQVGSRKIKTDIVRTGGLNVTRAPNAYYRLGVEDSVWRSRAWTMQEELFSNRKLIFTPERMVWTCRGDYWTEQEAREPSPRPERKALAPRVDGIETKLPDTLSFSTYETLVQAYSRRQMGYLSDSLNAFAGIERHLFTAAGYQVIWGLPQMWFTRCLAWRTRYETDQHHEKQVLSSHDGTTHSVGFPSWSWSAWQRIPNTDTFVTDPDLPDDKNLLIFYECSKGGCERRIDEQSNESLIQPWSPKSTSVEAVDTIPPPWVEGPQAISLSPECLSRSWDVSSGLLKFWTSAAIVYLRRRECYRTNTPWTYEVLNQNATRISLRINVQSTRHMDWPGKSDLQTQSLDVSPESDRSVLAFEAIVIGREKGTNYHCAALFALLVEWVDGIAYRRGLFTVEEAAWMQLERSWMLVTLG
ncbi:heterokaryon incompatibility protein-domain-containing protein [Clohesyomyces aquaticus]|uniref:Heterokaryon incompatibility protein-domain-containing protein n=1 Tax=Clohesyomyces aquaticus TaxID=1231657 RepID=A0A1Y1Z3F9_9PLEO|nr:heterokaryon incompatibility protein-domain-containing protein [Clohesyomyces aquaticus]